MVTRRDSRVRTSAAYARAVGLFRDWCAATGHTPVPCDWSTVETFLDAAGLSDSMRRVHAAAIAAAHREAGYRPPVRPRVARPCPARPDVTSVLVGLPERGWPGALFARRDALLLVLWAAGATPGFLAGLTVADLSITPERSLAVRGLGSLAAGRDPGSCPACVWLRWRPVLALIARWTPTRRLRELLTARGDSQPARDVEHRCARDDVGPGPGSAAGGAVFPGLDRWGNAAIGGGGAATSRALGIVLAAYRDGRPPVRASTAPPPPPAAASAETMAPPPRVAPDPDAVGGGPARRTTALAGLDTATARLSEVAEPAGERDARAAALIAGLIGHSATIPASPGPGCR